MARYDQTGKARYSLKTFEHDKPTSLQKDIYLNGIEFVFYHKQLKMYTNITDIK